MVRLASELIRSKQIRGVAVLLVAIASLMIVAGCDVQERWEKLPGRAPEVPAANLPVGMRPHNWVDANGSGSCVIASSCFHLQWCNLERLAQRFRQRYAGGQTETSIQQKWAENDIPYATVPSPGDPEFLEWASRTRRGAIIWYFPNHCVHFCGFAMFEGQEYAFINDNNREKSFIRIPKRQFISEWRGYGGYAQATLLPPAPSLPTPGYRVQP